MLWRASRDERGSWQSGGMFYRRGDDLQGAAALRRHPTPPALPVEVGINLPNPTPGDRGSAAFDIKLPGTGVSKLLTHSTGTAVKQAF